MSYKNPNHNEIRQITTSPIKKQFCKSYCNLAKSAFYKREGRQPTLGDAQTIMDIFTEEWIAYHLHNPIRRAKEKKIASPVWKFGCFINIGVDDSTREFVREINPQFEGVFDYNYAAWIILNNKFEDYKIFAIENKDKYPYRKPVYTDFSHLAYNGVTDDF